MNLRAWVLAARPKTLTAAVAPVLLGTALAARFATLQLLPTLAVFFGATLLQIASNFANDVFDYEKGADTEERLGPTRAVQAGLLTPAQMKRALVLVLLLALLIGVYLTVVAGPVIVAIGLCAMLCAVAYTGGPYPLGYHGLGDVFVFLFFGPVAVCGTVFVHLGRVPMLCAWYSVALGLLATNILIVNNLRDHVTDGRVGKRTLVVRLGPTFGRWQYLMGLGLAYALVLGPVLRRELGLWTLLPLLSAIPAARVATRLVRLEGAALNGVLAGTAKVVFFFGASAALGLWLDGTRP